jgi:NADH:ubiquinone oxidoreductase subunit 5 (subunit L)/multisubunit Na+/H+ antiporter MnhA subunit
MVSALRPSSTMVKAGVFMVVRSAPAFAGTFFSPMLHTHGCTF